MNKVGRFAVTVIFLVVLLGGFYLASGWISSTTGYVIKSDSPDAITACIEETGATLYTSPNCPECARQEQELSEVIGGFRVVDCSQSASECLVLSKLPAIERSGNIYYGFMSIDETRKILDC